MMDIGLVLLGIGCLFGGMAIGFMLEKKHKPLFSFETDRRLNELLRIHTEAFEGIQKTLENAPLTNKMKFKSKVGKEAYDIFANTSKHS